MGRSASGGSANGPSSPGRGSATSTAGSAGFEPGPATAAAGKVVITYGANSPEPRHHAARTLANRFGYATRVLPDAAHFVAWDNPAVFAATIRDVIG